MRNLYFTINVPNITEFRSKANQNYLNIFSAYVIVIGQS